MNIHKIMTLLSPCKLVLALVLIAMPSLTLSESLPTNYPDLFQWSGKIERITDRSIVISDREFFLNNSISIINLEQSRTSQNRIKVGMSVGCVLSNDLELISLWELPDSYEEFSGPLHRSLIRLH